MKTVVTLFLLLTIRKSYSVTLEEYLTLKYGSNGSCEGHVVENCIRGKGCGYGTTDNCNCGGSLYLYQKELSGTLPSLLGYCTNLQYLYFGHNELRGTLPTEWSQLQNVWYLHLSYNQLTGTLPSQWSQMKSLENIYGSNNQLSGTLPSSWQSLQNLSMLSLHSNQLHGTVPDYLCPSVSNTVQCELACNDNKDCSRGNDFTCSSCSVSTTTTNDNTVYPCDLAKACVTTKKSSWIVGMLLFGFTTMILIGILLLNRVLWNVRRPRQEENQTPSADPMKFFSPNKRPNYKTQVEETTTSFDHSTLNEIT